MKLIPLFILTISLAVDNIAHEHFTFPPQFQSNMFTSEKNPYLPPEAHTPHPYFQMNNNINKLQFPYLPPTATKAPMGYPSPFPMMMSSTIRPIRIEDDDDDEDNKPTTARSVSLRNTYNHTGKMPNQMAERREMRPPPKNFIHPIDRIDTKMPFQFNSNPESSTQSAPTQTMTRSINIMDFHRDHSVDQMKAASFQGPQYVPQPGVFISSTTETAIPILRLSNEMDLDGSFSYEALGADQTHYVQHSRMENAGTGKDEQVVEGSYSYVGDNGKTYTVHYIADANGFRASGDHLPVAPPIPEIIQRAIQYNLVEESKKPPHLKSWNGEQQENELSESEKRHQFAVSPPRLSSLFTGKTPESFSHSFSQQSNTQNNLVAAASSQSPVQASINFADQMQTKQNSGTISPQITFLASQGAHVPSVNAPEPINRMFTTEKSTMPQLVNYEANMKESDQESNKALWRWQYGINANGNQNNNIEKNSISRSFGTDDIVINFNDMTPDQYTTMIKQQLEPNIKENTEMTQNLDSKDISYYSDYKKYSENDFNNYSQENLKADNAINSDEKQYSTERVAPSINQNNWHQNQIDTRKNDLPNSDDDVNQLQNEDTQTSRPTLITQQKFIPQSQTVTQNYNYVDDNFESRRTRILNTASSNIHENKLTVLPLNYYPNSDHKHNVKHGIKTESVTAAVTYEPPTTTVKMFDHSTKGGNIKFTDFIIPQNENDFKPVFSFTEPLTEPTTTTTTTEINIEHAIEENLFLKNLFRNHKNEADVNNKIRDENNNKINLQVKPIETRVEKQPKYVYQTKLLNEVKALKKKPVDIADILNYIAKNQFESGKLKPATKQVANNMKQKSETLYYTPEQDIDDETVNRHQRTQPQQEELRGVIRNYKVLHRNNNYANVERNENDDRLKRNLSPPPLRSVNLPPLGRAGPSMKSYLPPIYI
ncbi:homeobox protein 13-like [Spodoptera litura]|uniref:Cuticular protein RR-1 n=1 Tax=Spodoptera litura TaxID=69820 RepID=A0A4U7BD62_SPOLT|nr:homeobox protein 13-like [Spodoptera litura]TKX27921.1 cuticular protein RR-1 [Spodoptera litura]